MLRSITIAVLVVLAGSRAAGAQERFHPRCGADVHVDDRRGLILLPQGDLFCPLVADPKSEHSFLSYQRGDFATIANPESNPKTNIGSVGLGDSFGLFRAGRGAVGNGVQLDIIGAIFAQFDLDAASIDLINADYLVGLPLSFRMRGFSGRVRLYHQSSHLGDEFLLSRMPERENLSFEAIELMLSQEINGLRIYAGGESYFRRRPVLELVPRLAHAGVELRPATFGSGRLVAALDVKVVDDEDRDVSWSARAGIEIGRAPSAGHPPRVLSILGEYYNGAAPYGQFYRDSIRYIGAGLHLTL